MLDEPRCKCGRMNRTENPLCRFCTNLEKHLAMYEETSDVIPVCSICKQNCEYFWITKNGITRCSNCIEVVA